MTTVYEQRLVGERAISSWMRITKGIYENRLKWPRVGIEVRKRPWLSRVLRRLRCAVTLAHLRGAFGVELVSVRRSPSLTQVLVACKHCQKTEVL